MSNQPRFKDHATTTLSAGALAGATSIFVTSVSALTDYTTKPSYVTIWNSLYTTPTEDSNHETVKVTAWNAGTGELTLSTQLVYNHSLGDKIAVLVSADPFNDIIAVLEADDTKLAGIEDGATADMSATEILNAVKTVDGASSGLDADILDGQHGSYYVDLTNATGTLAAARLSNTIGTYAIDPVPASVNEVHSQLGTPSVMEAAVAKANLSNRLIFIPPTTAQYSTDGGETWNDVPWTTDALKYLVIGRYTGVASTIQRTWTHVRLEWLQPLACGSSFLNFLYLHTGTNGNYMKVTIEKQANDTSVWSTVADTSYFTCWPGHQWIPHAVITYNNSTGRSKAVRITLTPRWDHATNSITLYNVDWFGGYPANAQSDVWYWDINKNATFQAGLTVNGNITVTGNVDGIDISTIPTVYQPKVVIGTCSTAASTVAKTVTISGYTPTIGDILAITFTNGNSAAAPTLSINGGSALAIKLGGVAANTTMFNPSANGVVQLYYDGTDLSTFGSYRTTDSTDPSNLRLGGLKFGVSTTKYKIMMEGADGRFYPLTLEDTTDTTKTVSTVEFKVDGLITMRSDSTTIAENGIGYNNHVQISNSQQAYTFNQSSGYTLYAPLYLVGSLNLNGNFVLDNTTYTSWFTQTLPSSDDGKLYIKIGYQSGAQNAYNLLLEKPIYYYKDGAVRQYIPTHYHDADEIRDFDTEVGNNSDVAANTSARHTHSNSTILDGTQESFTTTLKSKLDGIASGAEVNVQSDWNATEGDALILNKPTIPSTFDNLTDGTTNKAFTATEKTKLSGIAEGAEVNVNADWSAVSGDAQILNKPTIPSTFDQLSDGTTNKAYTVTEQSKLSGIETGADVTDATNVEAAGAVMDAEKDTALGIPILDSDGNLLVKSNRMLSAPDGTGYVYVCDRTNIRELLRLQSVDNDNTVGAIKTVGNWYNIVTMYNAVIKTSDQTIEGVKTFSSFPVTPSSAPTTNYQVANKKYVDDSIPNVPVSSVNTKTGAVVLTQDDVGDGTTNKAYTATEQTKLSGIATGAEVNVNADWSASSGDAQILNKPTIPSTFDDLTDGTTNKAYTATEQTKLSGIEASADVTDATNVTSAGAVMTSGDQTVNGVKTLGSFAVTPSSLPTTDYQVANKKYVDEKVLKIVTLTDGATVALDASLGTLFRLSAEGNRTISAPTNEVDGKKILIEHYANGADRTLSLDSGTGGFAFGTDITALTVTTSGKRDYIGAIYNSTADKWYVIAYTKGY